MEQKDRQNNSVQIQADKTSLEQSAEVQKSSIIERTLAQNPAVQALINDEQSLGNLSLMEEALLLTEAFKKDQKTRIIVKKNAYEAQALYKRLALLEDQSILYTMEESLRVMALASSPEQREQQVYALSSILKPGPKLVVASTASLLRFLPDPAIFKEAIFTLKNGMQISMKELKEKLYEAGYTKVNYVDRPGTFASRGGILDIFSLSHPDPIRIEFFDTEIDSIRKFSSESQRTIETLNQVEIWPATDILFSNEQIEKITEMMEEGLEKEKEKLSQDNFALLQEALERDRMALETHDPDARLYPYFGYGKHYSLLDYCDGEIVLSSKEQVEQNAKDLVKENITFIHELVSSHQLLPRYSLYNDLQTLLENRKVYALHTFLPVKNPISSGIFPVDPIIGSPFRFIEAASNENTFYALEKEDIQLLENNLDISKLNFIEPIYYEGFRLGDKQVYTRKELFQKTIRKSPYKKIFNEAGILNDALELSPGDYIVHSTYGIGQYLGVETKTIRDRTQDYLHIAYRDGDDLYVPLSQFQLVRKYLSKEGSGVKLSKLGSDGWEKTKKKVSEKVEEVAARLLDLYASRMQDIGYAYPPEDSLEREFDEAFEFESTPDQIKATKEIKEQMELAKPMDHLLCGDVGFGKTEVAMRAAFKAILSGKQVAFLCPTTILSMQHYKTISKRFEEVGAKVALVNRFTSARQLKEIKQDLKDGKIEILVGTHKLLSKELEFKDLGLLVVDEEQRFGVEQKEKMKALSKGIDVLTLSATPIPRTLQMSLIGVRTISTLNTPPANRLPVQTYVMEKRGNIIQEIIERELARNGQVFYLHNRIEDMDALVLQLQKQFPDHSIGSVHGRMSKEEIEDVMLDFSKGVYDILVCTTIIEIGMDIANANTIIIDQADRYGLAQLYQIRGRVGRRERLAYCYLMVDEDKQLTEASTKRLQAIKEFTQLGSGYKIAMRDLTIRGAGDMLGDKQSGFIDQVGLDLYLEMLSQAIARQKGEVMEEKKEFKKARVLQDGYIPKQFTDNDGDKLSLYQEIEEIETFKDLMAYQERVQDLFGKIPREVLSIFKKKRMDLFVNEPGIEDILESPKAFKITLDEDYSKKVDGIKLFEAISNLGKEFKLAYKNKRIEVTFNKAKKSMKKMDELMQTLISPKYLRGQQAGGQHAGG